uniref:hypothetical protein n=1 Tax=Alistipes sp. TaxID=1872444 RepID=UPI0040564C93
MKSKKLIALLRPFNVARFRLFNFKLWGDHRIGLYKEIPLEEISTLIEEFRKLSGSRKEEKSSPPKMLFRAGSNYAILSRLCEQFYIYEGSDKLQRKIVTEVEEIIKELRHDQESHAEFEAQINLTQDHLMERFRQAHPDLKEKEFRLYAYLAAGLSATTIAVLLGKEKSVVYNRISRLKKVIKEDFRLK